MSIHDVTLFSVIRCLLLVLLILPAGLYLSRFMSRIRGVEKYGLWVLLCFPIFVPELLAGYSYANFNLNLVQWPWLNELFYFLLLFIKVLPVSVIVFYLSPPPLLSQTAIHCEMLLNRKNGNTSKQKNILKLKLVLKQYRVQILFVFAVTFLYGFQEFQVASLLGNTYQSWHYPASWTVWLFDAQSTGMYLNETLSRLIVPLCFEFVIIIPLVLVFMNISGQPVRVQSSSRLVSLHTKIGVLVYGMISMIIFLVIPFCVIGSEITTGWQTLFQNVNYFKEILTGFTLAISAALISVAVSHGLISLLSRIKGKVLKTFCFIVILLPGFLGSLMLALLILGLFQFEVFSSLTHSVVPYYLAMVFFLLPRILILQILFTLREQKESYALVELMNRHLSQVRRRNILELKWYLKYRRQFWLVCLASMWAYWDLTISSILLPARYSTATVLLYNLMHYGRSETLSSILVLSMLIPVILICLIYILRKPAIRILSVYE